MHRRNFLKTAIIIPGIGMGCSTVSKNSSSKKIVRNRARPGDPQWPSESAWKQLSNEVGGNLIKLDSPFAACNQSADKNVCNDLFTQLKNPYYIGDNPTLTQTLGWKDAWRSEASVYAVSAQNTNHVVAAVNFARKNNLRLVVKGGGHSYQGTSNSKDSLLIWTRAINDIIIHDSFVSKGCAGTQEPHPAVSVGAGCIWMHVYDAVTTKAGRYVQGGGCATVGVAGLIQSGGFGSFSKKFGLAAAGLLEAEVVTADGSVVIVNACNHEDLFWAIKGGGGGSFGVVTKLTLKLRELPDYAGVAFGKIKAKSDPDFKKLIDKIIIHYKEHLLNPLWGEQIRFYSDNSIQISMVFQGINKEQVTEVWKPFLSWIAENADYAWETPFTALDFPARYLWDASFFRKNAPQFIGVDDRAGVPENNIFWIGDQGEAGQFLHAYRSAWLPSTLLDNNPQLSKALFEATRHWTVSLHFNKGLAGAPSNEIEAAKKTAMNPDVLNSFALAIIAGGSEPAYPGVRKFEPNSTEANTNAKRINSAMNELLKIAPAAGSYVSESDFFEKNWQQSFWGDNYSKLLDVKKKYDPEGLFYVHHGVGSEKWSDNGFTKISGSN